MIMQQLQCTIHLIATLFGLQCKIVNLSMNHGGLYKESYAMNIISFQHDVYRAIGI